MTSSDGWKLEGGVVASQQASTVSERDGGERAEGERERERERKKATDRQGQTETDTQRQRQTHRDKDREVNIGGHHLPCSRRPRWSRSNSRPRYHWSLPKASLEEHGIGFSTADTISAGNKTIFVGGWKFNGIF